MPFPTERRLRLAVQLSNQPDPDALAFIDPEDRDIYAEGIEATAAALDECQKVEAFAAAVVHAVQLTDEATPGGQASGADLVDELCRLLIEHGYDPAPYSTAEANQ